MDAVDKKKALRDDAMQGRVREGGDHLAAFPNDSKRHTIAVAKDGEKTDNPRPARLSAIHRDSGPGCRESELFLIVPSRAPGLGGGHTLFCNGALVTAMRGGRARPPRRKSSFSLDSIGLFIV